MLPLILAFDTSAGHCTACLLQGETVLAHRTEDMARGQAERLFPLLEEILAEGQSSWADLTALGVGVGPGNFTGIRISVAAARGLSLSLDIPAVGVSALEAIALGHDGPVTAVLPARRGHAFVQRFGPTAVPPENCASDLLAERLGEDPIVTPLPQEIAVPLTSQTRLTPHYPMAEAIARIASDRYTDAPAPAPLYLRAADAAPSSDTGPKILTASS